MPVVRLRFFPRRAAEVGQQRAARSVGLAIVSDPIGGGGADRSGLEPVRMADDPRGQINTVAPAHAAEAFRIDDSLPDEGIDSAHDVIAIAKCLRAGMLQTQL